ncbi:LysR family transcriptional regulator [Aliiroseovarius sp.]|uniref:LysR family transcriptional regulator n=1 Tax=Aliiroseovarius sp. TaxID=1872442 RepID=UPI003BA9FA09
MYKYLQSIAAFVAVAETGGFGKAATKCGVSPSVISHHVSRLEDHLGETLLYRTTRKLTLSEPGRKLLTAAGGGLAAIQHAVDDIQDQREQIVGALHVALPAFIPDPKIEARLMEFAAIHQNVALSLAYSDQVIDMLEDGFDLSIRLGKLKDSSFLQRKLADIRHVLVASPAFLHRTQQITAPEDLGELPHVAMQGSSDEVTLTRDATTCVIQQQNCRIQVQSIHAVKSATIAGVGVGNMPIALVAQEIEAGTLVQILPSWSQPRLPMHAVWPEKARRRNLTMRLVDFLGANTISEKSHLTVQG